MKDWNEITVMLKMTKSEAIAQLLKMGYQHEITYLIQDYYYLPSTADLSKDTLDLLNDMVLIRKFNESVKLTIKRKKYDSDGSIISQTNTDLPVENFIKAEQFLKELGYTRVMEIYDEAYIVNKDGLGFAVENVNNGDWLMLEIEENEFYPQIKDLKAKLDESGLHYDDSDYFVKKAQLVYNQHMKNI
ncbi:hypothetical protein [Lactococcus fujiensis]|nr:hypothetical protein [Lactococcus fujiensis]